MSGPSAADRPQGASEEDPLDGVVATCLESDADELDAAVERACAAHPESSAEIRRRIGRLRAMGLIEPAPSGDDERFPERLGDYRLLQRLGGGGMGVVFRARQESLGREVALKLIRPEQLYFPKARARFWRESEAAARLQHTGIVPVHTVGEEDGIPYFVMELVDGATLADALREPRARIPESLEGRDLALALERSTPAWARPPQPEDWAAAPAFQGTWSDCVVRLAIQIADALHHAHLRGVLHRDVKPSNVAVTPQGRALLFDFGLAFLDDEAGRLTLSRAEIGSLPYMSPEQIRGPRETVTARSDVYSLGVTLYELLSLRLPFEDADATVVRRAILLGAPRPLRSLNRAVPRDLETVCAKAMDRDPARRYVDAAALARDLRNVLERRPIDARPPSPALELYRLAQRHPIAATLLAALAALPSALTWQARHHAGELQVALDAAQEERRKAEVEALTAGEVNAFLLQLFGSVDPSNARGREPTARELLEVGARKLETELVDQPLVRTRLLNSIGESFTSLGQWELALETLGRALALSAGTPAAESLEHADSLDALAMLELQLGRPGALEHASQAVELRRRIAPEPSLRLAEVLLGYALVLQEFGQLDQAESAYLETLDMVEALPGDQRPGRVAVLANLANLHQARGQYESALAEARAALDLQRSLDPSPHPAIGSALNVIALSLNGLGRHEEALIAFDELLDQERRLTGEDSTRYATFLAARSNAETALGHRAEAIELLEQAAALFERSAPPEHLEAMDCRRMLGETYQSAARWPEALDVYAELLPLIESISVPGDGRGLALRARLALCYEALGAWPELEDILVEALERARLVDSADDDVSECVASAHLARALARRGDVDGAQSALARSLETSGQAALDTTPGAWAGLAAGVVAQSAGDLQRAVAELEPLADLERGRGSAAAVPAIARARLAAVLAASDPERSRRLAKSAQAELAGQLGPEHPETALLAALLESWR